MRIAPILILAAAIGWSAPALAWEQTQPLPRTLHGAAMSPASPGREDEASRCAQRVLAGRGCCSHHKGQCGCQRGRVECCDGTLSPSCRCEADDRSDAK